MKKREQKSKEQKKNCTETLAVNELNGDNNDNDSNRKTMNTREEDSVGSTEWGTHIFFHCIHIQYVQALSHIKSHDKKFNIGKS